MKELVEAKVKHLPIPQEEAAPQRSKVINLMDALRKSVRGDEACGDAKKKGALRKTAAEIRRRGSRW